MDEDGVPTTAWDMCRTCGGEAEISIFTEEGVEMQLEEKINAYLPITVSSSDDLPLAMCKECVNKLESCHQIVTSCIETEARLRQVIKLEEISEREEECQNDGDNKLLSFQVEDSTYCVETAVGETNNPINVFILNPCQNTVEQKQPTKEKITYDCDEFDESTTQTFTDKESGHLTNESTEIFQCKECSFENNDQQEYMKHVKSHNKNNEICKKFTCGLCNKSLATRLALTVHLRTHSGERPFKCQYCHRSFSQKPAQKYHERSHTGERPFVCSYCGKGFNSKVVRETHERVHTGERPFCCEECGASFRCVSNLRQHQAIHSEVHQFICHICGKHFRRPEKVRIHMRIHTGERPYACPICKRAFTQKGDMMKHTLIHTKSKNRHFSQAHSIKVENDEMAEVTFPSEGS